MSELAERAYRALLRDPLAGTVELAQGLSVSREQAGALVAELTEHGLLRSAGPGRPEVVPPERAVETLISREEEALERRRRTLAGLRHDAEALLAEFVDGRRRLVGELIEEIRGSDTVRSRLYQLSRDSTESVWTLNPGPAPPEVVVEASRRMDANSRARGVHSRSVFSAAAVADPAMSAYLADVVAGDDEVRIHPAPPLRLLIIDGRAAVIPLDLTDHTQGAYVLHSTNLVAPLVLLFELVWDSAFRFQLAESSPADVEEARLRRVVSLLASGHKDEAVARRVGVSVRTTRRLIALAVERLQAESRFQAGVNAVRHGWIPDSDAP